MGNYISSETYNEYNLSKKYGWKKDLYDVRDKYLTFKKQNYKQLKSKVDLRPHMSSIYDQESLGSCISNSICSAFIFDQISKNLPPFNPSRMFLYYNERFSKGMQNIDSGSSIRDSIKCINKFGICKENQWPYQINYFTTQPNKKCYTDAKFKKCLKYKKLDNSNIKCLKACLSSGKPFIFGFSVYSSFEDPTIWNPKVDAMPIPNPNKESLLGGHSVLAVGYSDKRKCFIIKNSWGKKWGLDGYFFMPYSFIISKQCDDFWTIETVVDNTQYVEKLSNESLGTKKNIKKESLSPKKNIKQESLGPKKNIKQYQTINIMIPRKDELEHKKTKCVIRDV